MPYDSTVALDTIQQSQSGHDIAANNIFKALSPAALFGIRQSTSSGLTLVLYGGVFDVSGTPTVLADQTVTLTPSAINYIYVTSAGVVTKTTSIPSGWPGPLAAGARALYQLTVGASTITGGSNYRVGLGVAGAIGTTGPQGNPGTDLANTRKRWWQGVGGGSTTVSIEGFASFTLTGAAATARTLASTSLREAIPYVGYPSSATAGNSAQVHHPNNWCYLGNAAGRGGFNFATRFCFEHSLNPSPANQRSFFGLFTVATIGNVEPDTLLNIIGIGAKAGDANLSFIHNDGSGTATMATLGANFPARATDNVYELLLQSIANSGIVSYTLTDAATGNIATGTASSDLPSNTTFLSNVAWINNGTTAAIASFGLIQVIGETRY